MNKKKLTLIIKTSFLALKAQEKFKKDNKRKKCWVRKFYQERKAFGFFEISFESLILHNEDLFFKATRMTKNNFKSILNLLKSELEKNSIRKPVSAECRLFLTLMYLAHGGSRNIYALKFRMAPCTVGRIILDTCSAIWKKMCLIYAPAPNISEWISIARDFQNKCQLPNCLGVIDGKHVNIVCPPKSGSMYFNYKKRHSVVLLAACDAKYTFTLLDIGAFGSQSDGGVFKNSAFGKRLLDGTLQIPESNVLPNSESRFPYFFVGDAAFPLKNFLMRPFPGNDLTREKQNFNKRISRARVCIENAFGILACRWRVLRNEIYCMPENVDKIVKATVVLHNFLRLNDSLYCPDSYVDRFEQNGEIIPGEWRQEGVQLGSAQMTPSNNASREAFQLRNLLCRYLHCN